jgi:hypothetical protein
MDKFNKKLYKSLKYILNNKLSEINKLRQENKRQYFKLIPPRIELYLFENNYVNLDDWKKIGVTPIGLEQLRELEKMKLNEWSIKISVSALLISIVIFIINTCIISKS